MTTEGRGRRRRRGRNGGGVKSVWERRSAGGRLGARSDLWHYCPPPFPSPLHLPISIFTRRPRTHRRRRQGEAVPKGGGGRGESAVEWRLPPAAPPAGQAGGREGHIRAEPRWRCKRGQGFKMEGHQARVEGGGYSAGGKGADLARGQKRPGRVARRRRRGWRRALAPRLLGRRARPRGGGRRLRRGRGGMLRALRAKDLIPDSASASASAAGAAVGGLVVHVGGAHGRVAVGVGVEHLLKQTRCCRAREKREEVGRVWRGKREAAASATPSIVLHLCAHAQMHRKISAVDGPLAKPGCCRGGWSSWSHSAAAAPAGPRALRPRRCWAQQSLPQNGDEGGRIARSAKHPGPLVQGRGSLRCVLRRGRRSCVRFEAAARALVLALRGAADARRRRGGRLRLGLVDRELLLRPRRVWCEGERLKDWAAAWAPPLRAVIHARGHARGGRRARPAARPPTSPRARPAEGTEARLHHPDDDMAEGGVGTLCPARAPRRSPHPSFFSAPSADTRPRLKSLKLMRLAVIWCPCRSAISPRGSDGESTQSRDTPPRPPTRRSPAAALAGR